MLARWRWAIGLLLALYLGVAVLISGLYDSRGSSYGKKINSAVQYITMSTGTRSRAYDFGGPGSRLLPGRRPRLMWCSALHFQKPPREVVALVSSPGSGNTWLRYLLQQATGIYTGAVYKDFGLQKNGFPAEGIVNGSVLVVKTHEWGPSARSPFTKAVLLVRSPAASIQAEFNRQSGGHVGFAAPERYKRKEGKYWQQFVTNNLIVWKQTNLDWIYNFTGPTHVIFYDQLVTNVEHTLKGLLDFLDIQPSKTQFTCALDRKEGIYRRKKRILNFDPYTPEMKLALQHEKELVYQAIFSAAGVTTNFSR